MFDPSNWFGRYLDLVMNLLWWFLVAVGAPRFVLGCHSFIVKIVYCCYPYRGCYSRSYFLVADRR